MDFAAGFDAELAFYSAVTTIREGTMTAYNVVRFKVKAGQEEAFIAIHKNATAFGGMLDGALIKTGDRSYCVVVKWESFDAIVASRSGMIALLDSMRHMLEDLGGGLGVTDPVSGPVVVELLRK
jgi:hypothetical protein